MSQNPFHVLSNPKNVKYSDLCKICDQYFGDCRIRGDHRIYKTAYADNRIINIQPAKKSKKMANPYQVKLVRSLLVRMLENEVSEDE